MSKKDKDFLNYIIYFKNEFNRASCPSQIQCSKFISAGTYGSVYVGSDMQGDKQYAIKILEITAKNGISCLMDISVMSTITAPGLATALDVVMQDSYVFLLMELADSDLHSYIHKQKKPIENIKQWMYQLIYAMHSINHTNVIHCDLKPNNILYYANDNDVKVGDFSLCMRKDWLGMYKGNIGSGNYRAPEAWFDHTDQCISWDQRVDVWSLGCIFFEMYYRKPFIYYQGANKEKYDVERSKMILAFDDWAKFSNQPWNHERSQISYIPSKFPGEAVQPNNELWRFLNRMLILDHRRRSNFSDLLYDPYLTGINLNSKYNIQSSKRILISNAEQEKIRKMINPPSKDDRITDFIFELYSRLLELTNITDEKKVAVCYFIATKITTGIPVFSRSFTKKDIIETEKTVVDWLSFHIHFSFLISSHISAKEYR